MKFQISNPQISANAVLASYVGKNSLTNDDLYKQLSLDLGFAEECFKSKALIGKHRKPHNLVARKVRWHQQSLRALGVIERMERGVWRLTDKAKRELTEALPKKILLAFNTDLGCALWGNSQDVFGNLQDTITLAFTSPPYPLNLPRQYGNVGESKYVDWLCEMLQPIVKNLRRGGNLVLNVGQDIFVSKSPSRSMYLERLTLALADRFGLHLMDRFIWENPTKPPGPIQWASLKRVQCNVSYEPVLWFTNDPSCVVADNRRVLRPHTEAHKKFIEQGGAKVNRVNSGGSYRTYPGSYSAVTEGAIPKNLLRIVHRDQDQIPARIYAKERGLPIHPALMPTKLADFFVKFLSEPKDLVVDPFGGWGTTAKAAENNDRRWLITERVREYLDAAAERFKDSLGYETFSR